MSGAWQFAPWYAGQGVTEKHVMWNALAVRDGEVFAAVPEPETYGLMALGLLVVAAATRRRKAGVIVMRHRSHSLD